MDNKNKIVISYEPHDYDAARKLSKDLTEKGLQINLINYDSIVEVSDIVDNYSHFLALLSRNPEKLAYLFNRFLEELEQYLYANPNFLIPIATDDSCYEQENTNNLPAISTSLTMTNYNACLSRIVKIIQPPKLKEIGNSDLSFQWKVTSELFKLPEDTRIQICRQYLGFNYDLNLPTSVLCKRLLKECHKNNNFNNLWEEIQSCKPKEPLILSSHSENDLDALLIQFYDAQYLTVDEVEKIGRNKKEKSTVILLAGLNNSGKTTLITSIYEYFQRGLSHYPYLFAGSKTFHELEQLCYLSRILSDGNNEVERTLIDQDGNENFLHLRLRDKFRKKSSCNIFLSDLPGELFRNLKKDGTKLDNMKSCKIAHQILFLINGEDLLSNRTETYTTNISILRTMIDYIDRKKLQSYQRKQFYLIISKWDLIQSLPVLQRNNIINYIDRKIHDLKAVFKTDYHLELHTDRIAARPSKDELAVDQNIVNLLQTWIDA